MNSKKKIFRLNIQTMRGFTFFEIMVTVAILATGIVMIYKALLLSLDYQNHLTHRLYAMNLLNNELTSIQRKYQDDEAVPALHDQRVQEAVLNNKELYFEFTTDLTPLEGLENIFQADLVISWMERGRTFQLLRTEYICKF